jgi:hypothetical protein
MWVAQGYAADEPIKLGVKVFAEGFVSPTVLIALEGSGRDRPGSGSGGHH